MESVRSVVAALHLGFPGLPGQKGRVLACPHLCQAPAIPALCSRRCTLSVCGTSLWPGLGSPSLHQGAGIAEKAGDLGRGLPGRSSPVSDVSIRTEGQCSDCHSSLTRVRLGVEPPEVCVAPDPMPRILGVDSGLCAGDGFSSVDQTSDPSRHGVVAAVPQVVVCFCMRVLGLMVSTFEAVPYA